MIEIILTSEQQQLWQESRGVVRIIDRNGQLVAQVGRWTDAEIEEATRRARQSGDSGTLRNFLQQMTPAGG